MLRFQPIYRTAPWGGRLIAERFARRSAPEGLIGESWELASFGDHESFVRMGRYEGCSLGELWCDGKLGGSAKADFPFLLKWIHATEFLSLQVHPDEATCLRLGYGEPKSEAWLIAEKTDASFLFAGHSCGLTATELRAVRDDSTFRKWLYELRPAPGDMIAIPPGTIHSIGPGYLLLEVQQPSSTTYRIYDWGRVGLNGQPRELHLDDAIASIDFERTGPGKVTRGCIAGPRFSMKTVAVGERIPAEPLRVFASHLGNARLSSQFGETRLHLGDVVVAEPKDGLISIDEGTCVWVSEGQDGYA